MKTETKILLGIIVAVLVAVFISANTGTSGRLGSVSDSYAYSSVVTGVTSSFPASGQLVKSGGGVLGSVVVTGTGTGLMELYDATTTNVNLRAGATSTLTKLASFANSPTVGTYVFDVAFSQGLIIGFVGAQASTTVTYR